MKKLIPFTKAAVAILLLDVSLIILIIASKLSRPTMMPWGQKNQFIQLQIIDIVTILVSSEPYLYDMFAL